MTVPQLHPEELLDGMRRGTLTPAEHRRLKEHMDRCPVCAFEVITSEDFEVAGLPQGGDDTLLSRVGASALALVAKFRGSR